MALLLGLSYNTRHSKALWMACCSCIIGGTSMSLYIYLLPEFLTAEQKAIRDQTGKPQFNEFLPQRTNVCSLWRYGLLLR